MTQLDLTLHPDGVVTDDGLHIVYDIAADAAFFGAASVDGAALVWGFGHARRDALLAVDLDPEIVGARLVRCDRIDFPPGGIANRHTHPGPGIRCQLVGRLTVTVGGVTRTYASLEPWFESGPDPVYAEASGEGPAAFVRVMVLPVDWAGRRTIRYVDPADEAKPKQQTARVYVEQPLEL